MKIEVVVTRHPALVEYLKEVGLADEKTDVVSHANLETVRDKHVCGVLPHSLSALTKSFTEVPLTLPAELRGQELDLEQIQQYAGEPVTYRVFTQPDFEKGCLRCTYAACQDGAPPINFETCF